MLFLTYSPAFIGVAPVQSPYPFAPTRAPPRSGTSPSIFTNNALVFYKAGSSGARTLGNGVANGRVIARRT